MSKTYNDVAQGKDNKTVRTVDVRETLSDIHSNAGTATCESDDPTPGQRLAMNTPGWDNGAYQPGADDQVAETFAAAFNEPDGFIVGLDDIDEPTPEQLADIESEPDTETESEIELALFRRSNPDAAGR